MVRRCLLLLLCVGFTGFLPAEPPKPGLNAKVPVTQANQQDWTFAVSNKSLASPPAEWLAKYDPKKATFDLFVPTAKDKQPLGLVVYIAADNNAGGAASLIEACKSLGLACAAVREVGNGVPARQRIHTALDVLDEVRRLLPIDADRTYVAGFSGGARMACALGFGLPELFGGILSIGAAAEMREEPYLRHRTADRLSVAFVVGEKDFNRGEAERFKGPILKDMGVRSLVKVVPGGGHGVPDAKTLTETLKWLEDGVAKRREVAKAHPASRLAGSLSREEQAKLLFDEGKGRLQNPKTVYTGLMQIKGVFDRWPDTRVAPAAQTLLESYDDKKVRPWEDEDINDRRKYLIARARGLTAYATGDLPKDYAAQRPDMAAGALEMWEAIIADGKDTKAAEEGKKRLPELKKLAGEN